MYGQWILKGIRKCTRRYRQEDNGEWRTEVHDNGQVS